MLTTLYRIAAALVPMALAVTLCACGGAATAGRCDFTVELRTADSVTIDTAALHVVNDLYGRRQPLGTAAGHGALVFTGQTAGQQVAIITSPSLVRPFYFVLEPGRTVITIGRRGWTTAGSRANAAYAHLESERQRLLRQREHNLEHYRAAARAGTLNLRGERQAQLRDSLLADSLDRLLRDAASQPGPLARIVAQRFL